MTDAAAEGGPDASDAEPAAIVPMILLASTDYTTTTEVAVVDGTARSVVRRITASDGDAVPIASGGRAFILERNNAQLHVLSPSGAVQATLALDSSDGGTTVNPHDVVVVPKAGGGSKAYVPFYGANRIAIVDLDAPSVTGSIDLSSLLDSADGDGSVDADVGTYLPSTGLAYFTVQRIDRTTPTLANEFRLLCPTVPSLVIGIDPATDALVDINGAAAGEAVALSLVGPSDIDWDQAGSRLLLAQNGCFETGDAGSFSLRTRQGVEAVSVPGGTAAVVLDPGNDDFFNRILMLGSDSAVVEHFTATFSTLYHRWQPSMPSLGQLLSGVPDVPTVLDSNALVGSTMSAADAGPGGAAISYNVSTGESEVLVGSLWEEGLSAASGTAVVR
jgi:hypothetical protein